MHIHPSAVGQHSINTYAASHERAAGAQRAADIRKRLHKSSHSIEAEATADPDATLLVGQWLDSRHSQVLPADEYDAASTGKDADLG